MVPRISTTTGHKLLLRSDHFTNYPFPNYTTPNR